MSKYKRKDSEINKTWQFTYVADTKRKKFKKKIEILYTLCEDLKNEEIKLKNTEKKKLSFIHKKLCKKSIKRINKNIDEVIDYIVNKIINVYNQSHSYTLGAFYFLEYEYFLFLMRERFDFLLEHIELFPGIVPFCLVIIFNKDFNKKDKEKLHKLIRKFYNLRYEHKNRYSLDNHLQCHMYIGDMFVNVIRNMNSIKKFIGKLPFKNIKPASYYYENKHLFDDISSEYSDDITDIKEFDHVKKWSSVNGCIYGYSYYHQFINDDTHIEIIDRIFNFMGYITDIKTIVMMYVIKHCKRSLSYNTGEINMDRIISNYNKPDINFLYPVIRYLILKDITFDDLISTVIEIIETGIKFNPYYDFTFKHKNKFTKVSKNKKKYRKKKITVFGKEVEYFENEEYSESDNEYSEYSDSESYGDVEDKFDLDKAINGEYNVGDDIGDKFIFLQKLDYLYTFIDVFRVIKLNTLEKMDWTQLNKNYNGMKENVDDITTQLEENISKKYSKYLVVRDSYLDAIKEFKQEHIQEKCRIARKTRTKREQKIIDDRNAVMRSLERSRKFDQKLQTLYLGHLIFK